MNDEEIWKRFKAGDKAALREIYDRELAYMLQYALRFSRNESLIQDCVHDLFVEICKNRSGIGMTTAIRPYLLVSLRRKVLKQLQKGQKSEAISEGVDFGKESGIEEQIIQGEKTLAQSTKLKAALNQLSSRQKEAIFLKYYEELDYEQVAETMNINYQSVRNLIFSGMKKLREILVLILGLLIFFEKI